MQTTLLSAVTTTGAGTALQLSDAVRRESLDGIVQAVISATATVKLQGSLDNSNWFDIATFTASGAVGATLPPYVRGNCTAYTSGTVTLKLDHPPRY